MKKKKDAKINVPTKKVDGLDFIKKLLQQYKLNKNSK